MNKIHPAPESSTTPELRPVQQDTINRGRWSGSWSDEEQSTRLRPLGERLSIELQTLSSNQMPIDLELMRPEFGNEVDPAASAGSGYLRESSPVSIPISFRDEQRGLEWRLKLAVDVSRIMHGDFAKQPRVVPVLVGRSEVAQVALSLGQAIGRALCELVKRRVPSEGRRNAKREVHPLQNWRLRRVVDFVEGHFAEPIRLKHLANVAGLTEMYFAAQFKKKTGLSPHEYLVKTRISRATEILADTKYSLLDTALSVGFKSQANFTTVFRRYVGETPRRWRLANAIEGEGVPARSPSPIQSKRLDLDRQKTSINGLPSSPSYPNRQGAASGNARKIQGHVVSGATPSGVPPAQG
jgi:AraC-like DNA-binding protein